MAGWAYFSCEFSLFGLFGAKMNQSTHAAKPLTPTDEASVGPRAATNSGTMIAPPKQRTEFLFRREELTQDGVFFTRAADRSEIMKVDLGEIQGSTPIRGLMDSLDSGTDAEDLHLLSLTRSALKHVRSVRHGDPIPTEVLSGEPSWTPTGEAIGRAVEKLARALFGGTNACGEAWLAVASELKQHAIEEAISETLGAEGIAKIRKNLKDCPEDLERQLSKTAMDIARIDSLQSGTSLLQRTVGEIAGVAADKANTQPGDLARDIGRLLRNAGAWGAKRAMAAEELIGRPQALICDLAYVRKEVWPAIRALHAFILDVEPLIVAWRDRDMSSDGSFRLGDLENMLRLAHQRFATFDDTLYFDVNKSQTKIGTR